MVTKHQIQMVKALTESFKDLGCYAAFSKKSNSITFHPKVVIKHKEKTYLFSDEDWNVVIMQLTTLYKTIKSKSKVI